jgi:hypothetical protein
MKKMEYILISLAESGFSRVYAGSKSGGILVQAIPEKPRPHIGSIVQAGGSMIDGLHLDQRLNSSVERLSWRQDGYRRDRINVTGVWELLTKTATLFEAGNPPLRPRLTGS